MKRLFLTALFSLFIGVGLQADIIKRPSSPGAATRTVTGTVLGAAGGYLLARNSNDATKAAATVGGAVLGNAIARGYNRHRDQVLLNRSGGYENVVSGERSGYDGNPYAWEPVSPGPGHWVPTPELRAEMEREARARESVRETPPARAVSVSPMDSAMRPANSLFGR